MKNIIISGGTGNLGQVVVQQFAEAGFQVIGTVRKPTKPTHINVEYAVVDLSSESQTESFVQECIQKKGSIEIAALLAGGFAMGDIISTSYADIEKLLAINFKTVYTLARPLFTHMQAKNGGVIFLIGSKTAVELLSGKNMLAYTLSKSLLVNMAEMLNEAGKEKKIAVHVLIPGTIDTPSNREAMPSANFSTWVKPEVLAKKMIDICEAPFPTDGKRIHLFY